MAGINSGEVKGRAARFFGNKVYSLFGKHRLISLLFMKKGYNRYTEFVNIVFRKRGRNLAGSRIKSGMTNGKYQGSQS